MQDTFTVKSEVWLYNGQGAWHFVSIPKPTTIDIDELFSNAKRGWGSLPVTVKVGNTTWETSIFPDKKSGTYLLPLKSEVRKAEDIKAGDEITFTLTLSDGT